MRSSGVNRVTIVLCIVFLHNQVDADNVTWSGFKVKFLPPPEGQWKIPLTLQEAIQEGYVKAGAHEEFSLISVYCFKDDPRACPMYDKNNRLCGFRVGFIKNTFGKNCPISSYYNYDTVDIYEKSDVFGMNVYNVDIIFAETASLSVGGPITRQNQLGDRFFFKPNGRDWKEIPAKETDVLNGLPGIVKQNCYPMMGQHYFFIDETTSCKHITPFFVMYDKGVLCAVGLATFGSVSSETRKWYENLTEPFVDIIFNRYPHCIKDIIRTCGGITLHMYMTEKPEEIKCPTQ